MCKGAAGAMGAAGGMGRRGVAHSCNRAVYVYVTIILTGGILPARRATFLLNVMGSNMSPLLMFVLVCCACKNFRCRQPKFVRQERFEYLMEQRDYRIKGLGWDGR